jgi:hypothetical protein
VTREWGSANPIPAEARRDDEHWRHVEQRFDFEGLPAKIDFEARFTCRM